MEVVVGVAIGVLIVVVIFSSLGIAFACYKRCRRKDKDHLSVGHSQNNDQAESGRVSPDRQLINEEADDPITLQHVLDDEVWVEDAAGAMNHCIPLLRSCHDLTSKLVPITVKECRSEAQNAQVEEMARKVMPRIDDVVQLLDGAMDPRLVEARCTALYYAVSNLVLVIKGIVPIEMIDWVDSCLADIEGHLKVLREKSEKLRGRSRTISTNQEQQEMSSPGSDISSGSTTKSGSRASSSHTDSTESGIDVNMPSDNSASLSPSSNKKHPIAPLEEGEKLGDQTDSPMANTRQYAVAEVHREMEPDSMEMQSAGFTNQAFSADAAS